MEPLTPVKALQDFLDQTSLVWNDQGDKPAQNSIAAKEVESFERPISIKTAYSQASFLFEAATDNSSALVKTLTEPIETIAPWGCARVVLETSALATWLWDERIEACERAERSLVYRHEGLRQLLNFARSTEGFFDPITTKKRMKDVENIALQLNFAKIEKDQVVFLQTLPTETEIIGDMLKKKAVYRLFSAMAHGQSWALESLSFIETPESKKNIPLDGGKYLEKNISMKAIIFLCRETVINLSAPILMKFKLFGWDSKPMELEINKAIQEMKTS